MTDAEDDTNEYGKMRQASGSAREARATWPHRAVWLHRLLMLPVIVGGIALACVLYDTTILSSPAGLRLLVNSDALLPMQMAWDLHHNPSAWASFQWPRVPSLFPDMLYFWACEWLGIGWRQAFLGYGVLMMALMAFAIGTIISRLQRGSDLASCCALAAIAIGAVVIVAMAGAQAAGLENWQGFLIIFAPVTHGDGLLLSLLAAPAAISAWRGSRAAQAATLFLCALGTFCDLLFLIEFLMPFVVVTRLSALHTAAELRGSRSASAGQGISLRRDMLLETARADLPLLRAMLTACVLGWAMTLPLFRQSVTEVKLRPPGFVVSHLGHDLVRAPWAIAAILATMALAASAWKHVRAMPCRPQADAAWDDPLLLLVLGAWSASLSLGLLMLLYFDAMSWRYALAVVWWPLAAGLSRIDWPFRRPPAWSSTMGGLAAMALAARLATTSPPGLLTWRSPLESCVAAHTAGPGLRAGLATYWYARQAEASSDWQRQIAQMTDQGKQRIWGNDAALYAIDSHNRHHPAPFNFIAVSPDVDRAAITRRYGVPQRRIYCPGVTIWQYAQRLHPPA